MIFNTRVAEKNIQMGDILGTTGSKLRREWRGGGRGAKPPGRWNFLKNIDKNIKKC